jgi:ribose transport system permease protein
VRRSNARLARRGSLAIWAALVVLFCASPLIASGSLQKSALLSMLPFAAFLIIAAIGQTLVIQQGGLDFSVPGAISLAAVIVTQHANGDDGKVLVGVILAIGACTAAGTLNGLLVARARIPPIIATLGVNALLIGAATQLSHRTVIAAPGNLSRFMLDKTVGLPNTLLIAAALTAVCALVMRRTVFGRLYEHAGTSPAAARIAGMPVARLQVSGYAVAGASYAVAGVCLAGYLRNPELDVGSPYLLSTVAAVVLGGASLSGGRASVVATAGGALFLSQIDQVVLSSGTQIWAQYLIQGAAIGLGMVLRVIPAAIGRRGPASQAQQPQEEVPSPCPVVSR